MLARSTPESATVNPKIGLWSGAMNSMMLPANQLLAEYLRVVSNVHGQRWVNQEVLYGTSQLVRIGKVREFVQQVASTLAALRLLLRPKFNDDNRFLMTHIPESN